MGQKTLKQYFENFLGVDLQSSDLTRDPNAAIQMINVEILENQSLMGRQGVKLMAQPLYIRQIHRYSYVDVNGVTQNELLGIGCLNFPGTNRKFGDLFKLVTSNTLSITRTGGNTNWGWSLIANTSTNTFVFTITQNSVAVYTKDLGNGYGTSDVTLKTLCDEIDALANFSCTCPKTAKVNGNQGNVVTVTVDSGHSISVGDMVYFYDRDDGNYTFHEVIATAATTIKFYVTNSLVFDFNDDDIIGLGNYQAAAILPLMQTAQSSVDTKTSSLSYWEMVRSNYHCNDLVTGAPFETLAADPGGDWMNPVFVNNRNCCYITAGYAKEITVDNLVALEDPFSDIGAKNIVTYTGGIWKYDGKMFGLSGFPRVSNPKTVFESNLVSSGGAGGIEVGNYRMKVSFLYIDAQENEVELFYESSAYTGIVSTGDTIQAAIYTPNFGAHDYQDSSYFAIRGARGGGSQTNVTVLTVEAGHNLRVGDIVWKASGWFASTTRVFPQQLKVTAFTETTVTVDQTVASFQTTDYLSNVLMRVWRTKNYGGFPIPAPEAYFLIDERSIAVTGSGLSTAGGLYFTLLTGHSTADDSLVGEDIRSVLPEQSQSTLPRGNALTVHQGVLVEGGGPTIPKQIYWEDAADPEFTYLATNNEALTFKRSGDVIALVGDNDGAISVFGQSTMFQGFGSLPERQVEFSKASEAGRGIAGSQAITDVEDLIMGAYGRGLIVCEAGKFDKTFGVNVRPPFTVKKFNTNNNLVPKRAIVFYDDLRDRVHFFIPAEQSASGASPSGLVHNTNSQYFIYDILNDTWYNFNHTTRRMPTGGFAILNEAQFYTQTFMYDTFYTRWTGYLHKRLDHETSSLADDYMDNADAYSWFYKPQWDDAGEPQIDKIWIELALFMLQPDWFVAAFDVSYESYLNWNDSLSDSDTVRTISFTTNDKEQTIKFNSDTKAKRLMHRFHGVVAKNPPLITGFEVLVDVDAYEIERFSE